MAVSGRDFEGAIAGRGEELFKSLGVLGMTDSIT
jgi:hypothetical protein